MSIPKANLLVVDDEENIRFFLQETLSNYGYQVSTAENGEAALSLLTDHEFDLALLDLKMPGISGIEVLAALRERWPDTVAIMLTAHATVETAVNALRQGAHDYLFKPSKTCDLIASVKSGLEKRQQVLEQRFTTKHASEVAHELGTAVSTIGLYVDLLDSGDKEEGGNYMAGLKEQTEQLVGLTKEMLSVSRRNKNAGQTEFTSVELNLLAGQIVAVNKFRARKTGVKIIFEPAPQPVCVWAKYYQVFQVINNLVVNALNYTSEGYVKVSVNVVQERGQACLQVEDTGMGITPEDLPHLFERYYRSQRSEQANIPGTGLGLAIVKDIVTQHDGQIEVESQVDKGTAFRVWLPLERDSK